MTKNEMLEFAKQVGLCWQSDGEPMIAVDRLEAFAKLVAEAAASKEREACAKVCSRLADEALVVGDEDAVMCFEEAENTIRARGEA